VQPTTSTNQAFLHQKTNGSMKTGPNEAKSRLKAALWVEPVKWVSLEWVLASSHSLEGSRRWPIHSENRVRDLSNALEASKLKSQPSSTVQV
jgi:hypothetical protein